MAKKNKNQQPKTEPKIENAMPKEFKAEEQHMIKNGLGDALGLGYSYFGTQLSQVDTLFKNNRWYLISNMRQLLSEIYVEHGLVQTIIDVPVDDGFRGGVDIKTKQLSEDQIHELTACMEREEDLVTLGQAMKWNRLYGGAGVLVLAAGQDYEQPLTEIKEGEELNFRAVDMWELFYDHQNLEGDGTPVDIVHGEHYNYYGKRVHKSRVFLKKGLVAPSFVRPRLRGWGFSVIEALVRSINQYLKANNLGFEVLDEFKLDVYKIKNLTSTLLQSDGTERIQKRISLANMQKNYQNAIVMDSEDDYQNKQLSFSGISEAMVGIRMQIASDMRMPLTKLFGISAQGFSSGEDDIENYNAMIEGQIRAKCKYDVVRMIELRCEQLFGFRPDDITIDFKPLRILSTEQEENVKTQKFARLLQARQAGYISTKEFKEGCNRENLLVIQVDTSMETLDDEGPIEGSSETEQDQAGESKEPAAPKGPASTTQAKPAPAAKNSLEFDKRAYEVDGGAEQFAHGRPDELFENPGKVDEKLWAKAKETSHAAFGKLDWRFITWKYKQLGGHFG